VSARAPSKQTDLGSLCAHHARIAATELEAILAADFCARSRAATASEPGRERVMSEAASMTLGTTASFAFVSPPSGFARRLSFP
jgi:hypothetical protein